MHNLKKHSGALDGDPRKDYVLTGLETQLP